MCCWQCRHSFLGRCLLEGKESHYGRVQPGPSAHFVRFACKDDDDLYFVWELLPGEVVFALLGPACLLDRGYGSAARSGCRAARLDAECLSKEGVQESAIAVALVGPDGEVCEMGFVVAANAACGGEWVVPFCGTSREYATACA